MVFGYTHIKSGQSIKYKTPEFIHGDSFVQTKQPINDTFIE